MWPCLRTLLPSRMLSLGAASSLWAYSSNVRGCRLVVVTGWNSPVVVVGWDLSGLVVVGVGSTASLPALVLLTLALRLWTEFAAVGRRWGDVGRLVLDSPGLVLQLSWFPSPSPLHVPLLHHLVLPSSHASFPLLSPLISPSFAPTSLWKGEGRLRLQPRF